MNKKIIILSMALLLALAAAFILIIRYRSIPTYEVNLQETSGKEYGDNIVKRNGKPELLCLCEDEESARDIAEMYGIDFEEFSGGVAIFTTDRNPEEVMQEGIEKGYPELGYNYIRSTYMKK